MAQEVISPAANARGCIIHAAASMVRGPAVLSSLIVKTSAPANIFDGQALAITSGYSAFTNSDADILKLDREFFVPAGLGVYFISNKNRDGGMMQVIYSLL
ncbi:hypothetical protein [Methylobacillus flagellatus]|uniref:hypothetical protein n=1 Tax=Methylobacillus flagellatus TaxID=405 RepID=UPI0018A1534E|nr:hypothetical protein [Methylobacillus flagellatus]